MERLSGLDPDERVLARAPASFRGATAASLQSTFSLSSARRRLIAYNAWRQHADAAGFTTAGPEMVLGLTEARVVVWSTTFWLSRPGSIVGRVPLANVHDVATVRHGLVTGLALALTSGEIIEVEAMRGRRLRHFAQTLRDVIASGKSL